MNSDKTTKDNLDLILSPKARETIDWLSKEYGGISEAEVIRRALGTERYIMEQQRKGARILISRRWRKTKELVF